eukprot:4093633-Amphidinium_carterae.3
MNIGGTSGDVQVDDYCAICVANEACEVVERFKPHAHHQHPTRPTLQALRVHLNGEESQLESLLAVALDRLVAGGRFIAICFKEAEVVLIRRCAPTRQFRSANLGSEHVWKKADQQPSLC